MFDVKNLHTDPRAQQPSKIETRKEDAGELFIHGLDVRIDTTDEIFVEFYIKLARVLRVSVG